MSKCVIRAVGFGTGHDGWYLTDDALWGSLRFAMVFESVEFASAYWGELDSIRHVEFEEYDGS